VGLTATLLLLLLIFFGEHGLETHICWLFEGKLNTYVVVRGAFEFSSHLGEARPMIHERLVNSSAWNLAFSVENLASCIGILNLSSLIISHWLGGD